MGSSHSHQSATFAAPRPSSPPRQPHPYPPTVLPGARDVPSPYGTCRVYEFGPLRGRKVLFIHGLSTPAPAPAAVTRTLAARGCRVMLLDLWGRGRGYSDAPRAARHDAGLHAAQILLALGSSAVAWTGTDSDGFALAGYSMGGGIAVAFAAAFPQLVASLMLMAPGGLYAELPRGYRGLVMRFPGWFPRRYVRRYVRTLLNAPAEYLPGRAGKGGQAEDTTGQRALVPAEAGAELPDVRGIVDWELAHHPGFVPSVVSAVRHAPVVHQHATWRRVGAYLAADPGTRVVGGLPNRLWGGRVLLALGEDDTVLPGDDFCRQATDVFGKQNVCIRFFEGGHVFPMVKPRELAEAMCKFWQVTASGEEVVDPPVI